MPRVPSASAAMVMKLRDASPVTRFPMLTPPRLSSPSPFETRRTISAASCGRFETSRRRVAFSYQRKAGMRSLSPCRMPAWLADVCEGSITSQRPSRIRRPPPPAPAPHPPRPQPARDDRHATGTHLVAQYRVAEAVDLDDHQAGLVGANDIRAAHGQLAHERGVVGLLLVEGDDGREERVDDGEDPRSPERSSDIGDVDAGD